MTTILADAKLGVMVSDSCFNDGDRVYTGRKVFRVREGLLGFAGLRDEFMRVLAWWKDGRTGTPPKFNGGMLLLCDEGLFEFDTPVVPIKMESGRAAIGSGGKGAICAYEAMGFEDPARAVAIACRHDHASRAPVRTYRL